MDIIKKYFQGQIVFLDSYTYNENTVTIRICKVEPEEILGELYYTGIRDYEDDQYDQEEGNYLESILEIVDEGLTLFLETDIREISFIYKTFEFRKKN